MNELQLITWLNQIVNQVKNGEINRTFAYSKFKQFEKWLKEAYEQIQDNVKNEIIKDPLEYKQFTLTTRKTLNYKENTEYVKKQAELKDLERVIKIATDMNEKGASYIDEDWVIIEPVTVSYSEVLTFKSK
jgi:hypothetical protein